MLRYFDKTKYILMAVGLLSALACFRHSNAAVSPLVVTSVSMAAAEQAGSEKTADQPKTAAKVDEAEEASKDDDAKDKSQKAKPEEDEQEASSSKSDDKSDEEKDDADKDDDDEPAKKDSDKPKKKAEKKPKPHKIERDELKIEVELSGIFVADEMEEVALRPEAWTQFKVVEAVEHGTRVKKGDVLIRFDDEKLEKELSDESLDQRIGELSLMQSEEEFPRLKRLLELSYEEAERRNEETKADYDYYHSTDRPFTVRIAHFRYKSAQEQLDGAQEELKQLEQMYEADEITEETEEIVLRRQRFAVETAELILELNKESRDYTLNVSLARSDQYYETAKEQAELAYKQAKTALEVGMTRKSYDMEKKRVARAKSVERHGKLLSDKGLMILRAPTDGVVYYGKCTKGKWSQITSLSAKLKPFGTASTNAVLMTIVKPSGLHVELTAGESDLPDLKTGLKAKIVPTADKELKLNGELSSVGSVPGASNKFPLKLEYDTNEAPEWLVAGMTCKASITTYENTEAVVVPLDLVQTDEENEDQKYVMIVDPEEEEPVRRNIKLGRKKGKLAEVLKGLDEGDEIIKEEKKDDDED